MLSQKITPYGMAMLAVLCLAGCDGDTSVEPKPLENYIVYSFDSGALNNLFYGYQPLTGVVDSFLLPVKAELTISVSANGDQLYIPQMTSSSVAVVDLDSRVVVEELSYQGINMAVSPDGKLVSLFGLNLYVINTSDYSIVFSDTNIVVTGVFSRDSKRLYCLAVDELGQPPYVYIVDLISGYQMTRKEFPGKSLYVIRSSPDESKWFLYSRMATSVAEFLVYDVYADSIIFSDTVTPGAGDIELTPNGRYVFYTNPGTLQGGPPPPSHFEVFEVQENRICKIVSTSGIRPDSLPSYFPVGDMAITPDGRWLAVAGAHGEGGLLVFDVLRLKIVRYTFLGHDRSVFSLTCQNSR